MDYLTFGIIVFLGDLIAHVIVRAIERRPGKGNGIENSAGFSGLQV